MKEIADLWRQSFVAFTFFVAVIAVAHEGKPHKPAEKPATDASKLALEKINVQYVQNIKPLFQNKCFDCHSSQIKEPWYRNLPGAKQLIDHDVREAKEHLDLESDFPFKSHATPIEDLEAIEETVRENEMPPLRYKVMHPGSSLTDEEKQKIYQWVQFGKETLKKIPSSSL